MNRNPFPTALFVMASLLFSAAVFVWIIGYMNSSRWDSSPAEIVGLYSSAGWLFNAGFVSTLAWLLARSIDWRSSGEADRAPAEKRQLNLGGDIDLTR